MKRLLRLLSLLAALAWLATAQKAAPETPEFEAAEILTAADITYPIRSVAWGTVVLQATISPSGGVEDVKVIKDIPSLTPEAVRSVRKWTFKPARFDGKPVRSVVPVAIVFERGLFGSPGS